MEYRTVLQRAQQEFTERKSRFIGHCAPVQTEEQALAFIGEIRAQHRQANHNVYAYVLRAQNLMRYSDDGEPQGTAGTPVLNVLQKSGTTDAVLVVTRYFGGILLGAGGLVRAYSHAASLAMQAAQPVIMRACTLAQVQCDYGFYGKVQRLLADCGCAPDDVAFGADVCVRVHMEPAALAQFASALTEASAGKVQLQKLGEEFFAFSEK